MTRPKFPDGSLVMDEHVTADYVATLSRDLAAAQAEAARLREALQNISDCYEAKSELYISWAETAATLYHKARAALSA